MVAQSSLVAAPASAVRRKKRPHLRFRRTYQKAQVQVVPRRGWTRDVLTVLSRRPPPRPPPRKRNPHQGGTRRGPHRSPPPCLGHPPSLMLARLLQIPPQAP